MNETTQSLSSARMSQEDEMDMDMDFDDEEKLKTQKKEQLPEKKGQKVETENKFEQVLSGTLNSF